MLTPTDRYAARLVADEEVRLVRRLADCQRAGNRCFVGRSGCCRFSGDRTVQRNSDQLRYRTTTLGANPNSYQRCRRASCGDARRGPAWPTKPIGNRVARRDRRDGRLNRRTDAGGRYCDCGTERRRDGRPNRPAKRYINSRGGLSVACHAQRYRDSGRCPTACKPIGTYRPDAYAHPDRNRGAGPDCAGTKPGDPDGYRGWRYGSIRILHRGSRRAVGHAQRWVCRRGQSAG